MVGTCAPPYRRSRLELRKKLLQPTGGHALGQATGVSRHGWDCEHVQEPTWSVQRVGHLKHPASTARYLQVTSNKYSKLRTRDFLLTADSGVNCSMAYKAKQNLECFFTEITEGAIIMLHRSGNIRRSELWSLVILQVGLIIITIIIGAVRRTAP